MKFGETAITPVVAALFGHQLIRCLEAMQPFRLGKAANCLHAQRQRCPGCCLRVQPDGQAAANQAGQSPGSETAGVEMDEIGAPVNSHPSRLEIDRCASDRLDTDVGEPDIHCLALHMQTAFCNAAAFAA